MQDGCHIIDQDSIAVGLLQQTQRCMLQIGVFDNAPRHAVCLHVRKFSAAFANERLGASHLDLRLIQHSMLPQRELDWFWALVHCGKRTVIAATFEQLCTFLSIPFCQARRPQSHTPCIPKPRIARPPPFPSPSLPPLPPLHLYFIHVMCSLRKLMVVAGIYDLC